MSETPNFQFHPKPRFSANHVAEYLTTQTATQREAVIRKAKFPRKVSVIAYSQALPAIGKFLASNSGDPSYFDDTLERLAAKARREQGYNHDEALRCQAAINAFIEMFANSRLSRCKFSPGPQNLTLPISGVRVNVRLDAPIFEEAPDGQGFSGGCVLIMASTDDARKNIDERKKHVAALIHWALEEASSQVEPLPRLCMSLDPYGTDIVRAPKAIDRLRKSIASSCREVAASWDDIEPPSGYDGPNWK